MRWWRVTKYDPSLRDEFGAYTRDEWTDVSCIGEVIDGHVLDLEEYTRAEDAYISAVRAFLEEAGSPDLRLSDLEVRPGLIDDLAAVGLDRLAREGRALTEGDQVRGLEVERACRLALRLVIWCRMESEDLEIHFGSDFYLYFGTRSGAERAIATAEASGLFVEPIPYSPYERGR